MWADRKESLTMMVVWIIKKFLIQIWRLQWTVSCLSLGDVHKIRTWIFMSRGQPTQQRLMKRIWNCIQISSHLRVLICDASKWIFNTSGFGFLQMFHSARLIELSMVVPIRSCLQLREADRSSNFNNISCKILTKKFSNYLESFFKSLVKKKTTKRFQFPSRHHSIKYLNWQIKAI